MQGLAKPVIVSEHDLGGHSYPAEEVFDVLGVSGLS